MVRAQILRYISRPEYTRQSPDCPLVIFSFTALPSCLHCSTQYSSAFAQHCIVAHPPLSTCCTHVHPHCIHHPRVSPSTPLSLLQVRPLPPISSESQHRPRSNVRKRSEVVLVARDARLDCPIRQRLRTLPTKQDPYAPNQSPTVSHKCSVRSATIPSHRYGSNHPTP